MQKLIRITLLIAFLMLASFIAGRTCLRPEPYLVPIVDAPAELMSGKRCDWDLQRVPLAVLVDRLTEGYGVTVRLDERFLSDIGLSSLTPVTLCAKQIELWEVPGLLQTTEEYTLGAQMTLVWRGNIAWLMTWEHAAAFTVTRTYNARALYRRLYGVPMPPYEFTDTPDGGIGTPPTTQRAYERLPADAPPTEEFVEIICSLIRETVGVGTWKEDGGQIGSLRELNGLIIVTTLPRVHAELAQKLDALSNSRPNAFEWRPATTQPAVTP